MKGSFNSKGYLQLSFNGCKFLKHRYIWETYHRKSLNRNEQIDHINGDKTDNRISNLRIVNNTLNSQNKNRRVDSKCDFKGVTKLRNGKYMAKITIKGTSYNSNTFNSQIEAAKWYDIQALKANEIHSCTFKTNF